MKRSRSSSPRGRIPALALLALAAFWGDTIPARAAGQEQGASGPPVAEMGPAVVPNAAQGPSRLDRLLTRFFGEKNPSGQDLAGRVVSAVDRFADDSGSFIEVVLIHPVERFEKGWDQEKVVTRRLLNNLTSPLQSYTDDWVIRDFLLFRRGDRLDPYLLADSERLLRNLSFISDVQINVVPLNDTGDTVAVVVQTTDRWPLGVDGDIKSEQEYRASLYTVNLLGTGLGFSNELYYRKPGSPATGYRGILRMENLAGTFWDAEIEYENTHRERQDRVSLERNLVHPGIHNLGGVSVDRVRAGRESAIPNEAVVAEAWTGMVFRLYDRGQARAKARPLFVPTIRFVDSTFLDRPAVSADTNLGFHENRLFLGGLFFRSLEYYKTSFLLGLGETENVPRGYYLKTTGGYQDGEFRQRVCLFLDAGGVFLQERGDVAYANAGWGGYFRNDRIEQGMFKLEGGYYSSLMGAGRYRTRVSGRLGYTMGIRRLAGEFLSVRPDGGLRVLPDQEVAGNRRLTAVMESNLFTPWSLLGFRVSCFSFMDAGVVGAEQGSSLFREKVYFGTGVGFNLRNPDLVLPTWRFAFALRNRVEGRGTDIQISIRSSSPPTLGVPGAKAALPVYR